MNYYAPFQKNDTVNLKFSLWCRRLNQDFKFVAQKKLDIPALQKVPHKNASTAELGQSGQEPRKD